MSEQFRITVNELCHINDGKKRKINLEDWQNQKNKMSKDRGEEYVGGRGIVKQAKIPPPRSKPVHHDAQSPGVGSLIHDANRFSKNSGEQAVTTAPALIHLFLSNDQGLKVPVCVSTFLSTFGITPDRLRTVKEKLASGTVDLADKRGTNTLHERVDPTHADRILAHINSFPRRLAHYSREAGNPLREYLDPTLTVSKMFTLFRIQEGEHVNRLEWLYRQVFREQPLKIGIQNRI
ncbi:hypothetical protein Fcan01_13071 [Folsomia candida]|uniref:Uncharacterized protein n=1 Tax=Folsomia candida TaxID=158441 RepID=A0A226E5P3_FOLCA|nr:hypothetical protein Fcan01_13071 [Folsomia candida]